METFSILCLAEAHAEPNHFRRGAICIWLEGFFSLKNGFSSQRETYKGSRKFVDIPFRLRHRRPEETALGPPGDPRAGRAPFAAGRVRPDPSAPEPGGRPATPYLPGRSAGHTGPSLGAFWSSSPAEPTHSGRDFPGASGGRVSSPRPVQVPCPRPRPLTAPRGAARGSAGTGVPTPRRRADSALGGRRCGRRSSPGRVCAGGGYNVAGPLRAGGGGGPFRKAEKKSELWPRQTWTLPALRRLLVHTPPSPA